MPIKEPVIDSGFHVSKDMKMTESHRADSARTKSHRSSTNPVAVQAYLKGINYPASKEDILDRAAQNKAPNEIMSALKKISEKRYSSPAELTREVGQVT